MIHLWIVLVLYVFLAVVVNFGDSIVNKIEPNHYSWRALTDSTFHCLVAILTWLLTYYHSGKKCFILSNIIGECLLAGFIGSIVDVDHFLVARTFSIETALNHVSISRPFLHWTTLWLFLCGILSVLHHNLAVLVLSTVLSHHLRDAARRGMCFYPFFSTPPIPSILCLCLMLSIPVISSRCFHSHVNKTYSKDILLA